MSSFRLALAVLAAGFVSFAGVRLLRADDTPPVPAPSPAPLTEAEQARVKQWVENLGSDDFRVREAASKALTEMGERARAALQAAAKSDVPEVRFRADQILRRLDGAGGQKGLETDGPAGTGGAKPGDRPSFPAHDQVDTWMKEMERQMEEMRQQMEKDWGQGGALTVPWQRWFDGSRLARTPRHFSAEGADLKLSPRGATLTLTEKSAGGVTVTTAYEGKSLDAILEARPEAKGRPGVASVIDQAKRAEEAAKAVPLVPRVPGGMTSGTQGLTIETMPGHAKVTVTEPGEDGKPVTKTYEGTDLDAIKAAHPELADRLGGVHVQIGRGRARFLEHAPAMPGSEEDENGEEADETLPTGPFGLGLAAPDAALKARLGLEEGAGLVVRAVREKSDAESAGLKKGDALTAVNGKRVDARLGIAEVVREGREKGSLSFDILRDGKPLTLTWKK